MTPLITAPTPVPGPTSEHAPGAGFSGKPTPRQTSDRSSPCPKGGGRTMG